MSARWLGLLLLTACAPPSAPTPLTLTAVTFNTGTTGGLPFAPDAGYGADQAALSDRFYGDGLAWLPAVENTTAFFAALQPDVVAFQEIFHPEECAAIPADAGAGFVCERWQQGDPTVAQRVLGAGYQVACQLGKPDKCLGVRRAFGSIRGCASALCLDGLAGARVEGCGGGSRVGRGVIDLPDGGALTVVTVHGTSGLGTADQACRIKQVEQVFVELGTGDGPGANGSPALIAGDLNTDPGRLGPGDASAVRWRDFAGPRKPFHFLTAMGPEVPPSYGGLFNIDHLLSDTLSGDCWIAGVTPGHPEVNDFIYFDHKPHVCTLHTP